MHSVGPRQRTRGSSPRSPPGAFPDVLESVPVFPLTVRFSRVRDDRVQRLSSPPPLFCLFLLRAIIFLFCPQVFVFPPHCLDKGKVIFLKILGCL
jgi:hypothetical protein